MKQLIFFISLIGTLFASDKFINYQELYDMIDEADTIKVIEPYELKRVLFSSSNKEDIKSFKEALTLVRLKPDEYYSLACIGSPVIYFYKNKKELTHILVRGSTNVGYETWPSDVPIKYLDKWLEWFDKRGMTMLREDVEREEKLIREGEIALKKWKEAVPDCFKKDWIDNLRPRYLGEKVNVETLNNKFKSCNPDKFKRILVLLKWYGSGKGPWSGYPSYEEDAEKMLLKYSTKDILDTVKSASLSNVQKEGLARLFAGYYFRKQRKDKIPKKIKYMLWEYIKTTKDKDKLERAKHAFRG